ncbi:MAG: cysteine--tRNA ligase [Thermoplasmata archaeon]
MNVQERFEMSELQVYNSMTRQKEKFVPLNPGRVGIYVCGVTVYDDVHLGHARSAIAFDAIIRYLRYKGYQVNHVTNFTDVDDKIIERAKELGIEPLQLSRTYIDKFFEDMDRLRVRRATVYPKASETIPEIIAMTQTLLAKGCAYVVDGDVYFDITKAKDYGKLSGQSIDQMLAGARVEIDEKKRHPADFALWKAAKPGEISWPSPWGPGRPGWHIECSAMCLKYIGPTLDIHGGGSELIFPHHENEIQQSEAANGVQFVRYWMHNGLLMINEEKMSKSLQNFFTVREVCRDFDPSVIRFFLLNTHYRQPLNYDLDVLNESKRSLERLQNTYRELLDHRGKAKGSEDAKELCEKAVSEFEESMNNDFNTRDALAAMFNLAREANRLLAERKLSESGVANILSAMERFDSIFDILTVTMTAQDELLPKVVDFVLKVRESARMKKDFETADAIRSGLESLGIEIQDSADGPKWKIKK